MKNRSYFFFVAVIILSMSFSTIAQANATQRILMKDAVEAQSTLSGDVVFPFVKGLHLEDNNKWNLTDELSVNKTLENIPSFEGPGITAYTGNDVVPQISANRYLVNVTFINATIYDDHDTIGAGDIYFNVTINGNFTQTAEYETNNGETIFLGISYFTAWCLTLDISVEAWDADTPPTPDDELGVFQYQTTSPISENISGLTDIGDALIHMEIEVLDTQAGVTAEFLADGCKPYLYFCDETSYTEEADEVYSRVLVGYDSTKSKNVVIVQYIYYWIEEYFPFPVDIKFHDYDFEQFLIFIDPSDPMNPYRYVFDDGSYVSNTHSSRIAIWENTATTAILETDAYIYEDLIPLLGENYTTDYKIFNLADATDELRTGLSGMTTMNILVQTSFHNFQEGPPGLLDLFPNELGYNYTINELNDSKIREFFRIHYEAFEEGLWWITYIGADTPKVHPFTFDIMDPFVFPYLINGYPNVVDDIERFQKARDNRIEYDYSIDIEFGLYLHARYTITSPDEVNPGDEFDATIEVEILDDQTEIALNYDFLLNGTVKALFFSKNFLLDYGGKIGVNIPLGTMRNILEILGMHPYTESGLNIDDAGYVTLDHFQLAANLLGNIMEANVSVHLWDIMYNELPGYFPVTEKPLEFIDFFMDAVDLKADSVFTGLVNGSISSSNLAVADIGVDSFEFDGITMTTQTHVIVSSGATDGQTFNIVLDDLAFLFSYYTDWHLDIDFGSLISFLAPQYATMSFDLGRFPNIQLMSGDSFLPIGTTVSKTTTVDVPTTPTPTPTPTPTTTTPTTADGGIALIALTSTILGSLMVVIIVKKYRK